MTTITVDQLLGNVRSVFERLSVLSASCGGCQKEQFDRPRVQELGFSHVFALIPLTGDPEAVRATQRGVRLVHENRIEEALRELHDAKQMAPKSSEACCNLGCAYHMSGDDNAALFWYREAYRFAPKGESAVLALSLLEQRRGQVDEAQRLLVTFLQEVDASHVGALKQLGRLHQVEGNYSKAAGCYHRLIAIDPTNYEWPAQLQVCLDQVPCKDEFGKPVQSPYAPAGMFARAFSFAEPVLRGAVPMDPGEVAASTQRAPRTYGMGGLNPPPPPVSQAPHPTPSRGHDRGSFDRIASGHAAPGVAAQMQEAPHPTPSRGHDRGSFDRIASGHAAPGVAAQMQEARRHRECGRSDAALQVYRGILRLDGGSAEAFLGVADCQDDLGDFNAALEAVKQLLNLRPDDPEANLRAAELLLAAGHGDAYVAEPYLKRAADGRSKHLQHRLLCAHAEVALALEDHAKALASAAEAVRVDASAPRSLVLLGTCRLRVAEYAAALRAFTAAADACVDNSIQSSRMRATACMLSAQAHERLRQYAQALQQAQAALEVQPQMGSARIVRAMVYQQSGRGHEAEVELEAVLQREPKNAVARLQLGYCQLTSGDAAKSAATLEAVVTGAGGLPRSALGAAKVYLALALDAQPERSGHQQAERVVREGLALHKNLQHVWQEIESGLGQRPTAAVQRLRGICDLDLTSQQAKQLTAVLARATGQPDLARAVASGPSAPATPSHQSFRQANVGVGGGGSSAGSRAPSVPPCRWAPSGPSFDAAAHAAVASTAPVLAPGGSVRLRSASPGPIAPPASYQLGVGGGAQWQPGAPQLMAQPGRQIGPATGRGRSTSPGGYPGQVGGYHSGYQTPAGGGSGHATPVRGGAAAALRRAGSREVSPMPGGGTQFELSMNEVIRPEQLVFGPQLGAGGSAQVYRGSWNGQEVAIKKIGGVAHLEEMRKEINALRRLRHPRLVRFMGATIQPPLLLVVTEFMPGGSLHDRLFGAKREPPMVLAQRWTIAVHMAEGLSFLHSQRVVHRDLKSMNILLDAHQNAKICDFGLAQQMEMQATQIPRKLEGEGGSPRYMAPECYDAKHGKLTEKVDVWAMGCILLELFAGVLPYADCGTMAQLSARILVERRPPDVPASVPPPLAELMRRCMMFDQSRRLCSGDILAELGRLRPPR